MIAVCCKYGGNEETVPALLDWLAKPILHLTFRVNGRRGARTETFGVESRR
jgi:hypothetical protein